jgi:DNA end-binding protein Ku
MAPRANWKGYLRLSLVSCPIALYPASSLSEKVSFNRINRKTGNRLKQQNVDAETGEVVSRDDMVRGYEVAKGQYMIVEDEEIEAVQIESTRTIDIDQFVPKDEIDERYIDSPYYIAPDGQVGQEAFAVIRDTIAKLNMVALGRVVLTRREHVIALESKGRGLVGTTFRGYPRAKAAQGDARPGCPYRGNEVWSLRLFPVRGSLRKRADRSIEEETGRRKDRTRSAIYPTAGGQPDGGPSRQCGC